MLKSRLKKIGCLLLASVLLSGFFQLTACYKTQSGKKSDIVGTYKLVKKTVGRDSSGSAIDLIEQDGIVEYLVIGENGKGFRIYGDNENETKCSEIRITFEEDDENPGLYDFINYFDPSDESNKSGRKLGYYASEKMLNFGTPSISSGCVQIKESAIAYKKVSDEQTLKTVESETGKTYTYIPYELYHKNGAAAMNTGYIQVDPQPETFTSIDSDYIYFVLDIRAEEMKADVYYALKSDEVQVKKENLDVSFTLTEPDENNNARVVLTIGEFEFKYVLGANYWGSIEYYVEKDGITYQSYFDAYITDVDAYIEGAIKAYNDSKPTDPDPANPGEGGESGNPGDEVTE